MQIQKWKQIAEKKSIKKAKTNDSFFRKQKSIFIQILSL